MLLVEVLVTRIEMKSRDQCSV